MCLRLRSLTLTRQFVRTSGWRDFSLNYMSFCVFRRSEQMLVIACEIEDHSISIQCQRAFSVADDWMELSTNQIPQMFDWWQIWQTKEWSSCRYATPFPPKCDGLALFCCCILVSAKLLLVLLLRLRCCLSCELFTVKLFYISTERLRDS